MNDLGVVLVPLASAALLAVIPGYRISARAERARQPGRRCCSRSACCWTGPATGHYLLVDDLNIVFILLNMLRRLHHQRVQRQLHRHELETGRLTARYLRFYHAMFQLMLFGMNLALLANNIGLMWVAVELATLTTVDDGRHLPHRTRRWKPPGNTSSSAASASRWRCSAPSWSISPPARWSARAWTPWSGPTCCAHAHDFDPALLNIAFIFLLLGYGTKVGLAPMHAWLPDAHAEGPTPISAVLSGLLLNVALYALLRFKVLLAGQPAAIAPGPLMIGLGLLSLIFAGFMLYRRRDIKRLFAYSSIEHMGIIVFAFGMAGPLGNFAGLLQMTMHSLTKSAIFFAVGHVAQVKGTQRIADMGGLTESHPVLGWALVAGVAAIAGLPPFGVFTSEFLVDQLDLRARSRCWRSWSCSALLIAFGALLLRLTSVAFGAPRGPTGPVQASYMPMFAHLALVLIAGIWLPGAAGRLVPARRGDVGLIRWHSTRSSPVDSGSRDIARCPASWSMRKPGRTPPICSPPEI